MRSILLAAILLVTMTSTQAQTVVQKRAARLGMGANLAFLDGYWRGTKDRHFSDFVKPDDLLAQKQAVADIAGAGFKTVRIPICFGAWASLDAPYNWDTPEGLTAADSLVNWAIENKLNVIIDLHHVEFDGSVNGADTTARIVWLWKQIASRYRTTNPEKVLFELRNEPHDITATAWRTQARQIIQAVRAVAPRHTLIVGFKDYNGRDALLKSEPFVDPNIIYTFHFYDPFVFTHQGTNWSAPGLSELRDIPFPANTSTPIAIPASAKGSWVERDIKRYSVEGNAETIYRRLAAVKGWSTAKHVPVFMGEFGSFDSIAAESRCRYVGAVCSALAKLRLPAAIWEWNGNFSPLQPGTAQLSPCMAAALRRSGQMRPVTAAAP